MTLQRKGNKLTAQGHQFLISERKYTTPTKSKYFLLKITPTGRKYISSLYGEYPVYNLDYQGKKYQLVLSENTAKLKEIGVYNV